MSPGGDIGRNSGWTRGAFPFKINAHGGTVIAAQKQEGAVRDAARDSR